MNTLITKAKLFFSTYKWLLIPIIPIILFVFFIIIIIDSNQTKKPSANQQNTLQVSQSPSESQGSISPSVSPQISPYGLYNEVQGIAFGKMNLLIGKSTDEDSGQGYGSDDEFADGSINQQTLPDGSVKYEYQSDDPQRPHMQVVKNGVILFRRNLMPEDTTTDYYSSYLQKPEYTSQGSSYYGTSAMIYASPTNGLAIVFDPETRRVYEQYLFPAISVSDYLKKFGSDITSFTPAP